MINLINANMFDELPHIEAKSIDLILLDLPYGQTECEWDKKVDLENLWRELKRIAKPTTAFIFFCTTRFGYELIKSNEKMFRYELVWNKQKSCGFLNARKQPMRMHEMIYVFYNKLPTYNIQEHHSIVKEYNTDNIKEKNIYGEKIDKRAYWYPQLPTSILSFKCSQNRKHPTEKPIELYDWIIKYYSLEGDNVLDVCYGSANSARACKSLNRNYIGFELNTKYFEDSISDKFLVN